MHIQTEPHRLPRRRAIHLCIATCMLGGCSGLIDPNVPEPIHPFIEPEFGGDYQLYRPSNYDRRQGWPLMVICHSTFPDSPNKQLHEWTQLAETYGFVAVAPQLTRAKRSWRQKEGARLAALEENERRVLATIRHVRASHNISDDRVLIYGWDRGAQTALHTGLRNPQQFRAIALTRPRLDDDTLSGTWSGIDRYQPVQVHYNVSDAIHGGHARSCVKWLRSIGAKVDENTIGTAAKTDAVDSVLFFQRVIRDVPWLHIRAFTSGGLTPLETHFKLKSSFAPTTFRWNFGDGDESVVAEPVHLYTKSGRYRVSVTVLGQDNTEITRVAEIVVPGARLQRASHSDTDAHD
ncbi:MAG: PKD domain-containing protein [Planctomycetes bacterium]|nr:PKD domain-containing protein [Planctomycetota bacterium]